MEKNGKIDFPLVDYLATYLSFYMPSERAWQVASALANRYGTLYVMAAASESDLLDVPGMNPHSIAALRLLAAIHSRRTVDRFKKGRAYTERQIRELLRALFLGRRYETLICLSFDKEGKFIATDTVGDGTINLLDIAPRRVLDAAVERRAKSVIIAHNHPKGAADISRDDRAATDRVRSVLEAAGISLVDHYLVTDELCLRVESEDELGK